jgi:anti-sigma B factor antagonist
VTPNEREVQNGLLTVRIRPDADRCLVSLNGEVDLSNAEALEATLQEAIGEGPERVVIDMRDLSFIDSTGIACLVRLLHEVDADRLRFVHSTSPAVVRVLQLTGVEEKLTPAALP